MSSPTLPTPTRAPALLVPAGRPCPSAAPPGTPLVRALGPGPFWRLPPFSPGWRRTRGPTPADRGRGAKWSCPPPWEFTFFSFKLSTLRWSFLPAFAGNPAGGSFTCVYGAGGDVGCRVAVSLRCGYWERCSRKIQAFSKLTEHYVPLQTRAPRRSWKLTLNCVLHGVSCREGGPVGDFHTSP